MIGMYKKNKKIILGAVGIFVSLFVCYLIGQNIVLPNRLAKEGLTSYDGKVPEISFVQHPEYLIFEGKMASEDFPGGQTVGFITMDGNMKAFLVTPETAIYYDFMVTSKTKEISFVAGYHPMIEAGVADGAVLKVEVISIKDDMLLAEEVLEILPGASDEVIELELSQYKEQEIRVSISCEAGAAGDESGDWIILKYLVLE